MLLQILGILYSLSSSALILALALTTYSLGLSLFYFTQVETHRKHHVLYTEPKRLAFKLAYSQDIELGKGQKLVLEFLS